jgi:predicted hotdog family 3-hydroxylacyl-ACP dehydratase
MTHNGAPFSRVARFMTASGDAAHGWQALIPHQGAMCLLDEIVAWDANAIHMRSCSHLSADNPLRSDGRLRSVHLSEYGAQAMAVHGGLLAREAGGVAAPGLLVSLRAVELFVERIDDLAGMLDIHAEKLVGSEASWQYAFRVEHDGVLLARGRAAVLATVS